MMEELKPFFHELPFNLSKELSGIAFDLMNKDPKGRVAVDEVVRFVQNISAEE